MKKELQIKNVKQFHCESYKGNTLALWVETTDSENPINDVREVEKERDSNVA